MFNAICQQFYVVFCGMNRIDKRLPPQIMLSAREQEILKWVLACP